MTITHVVKRDGSLEKFDINKVLKWELWACEGIKQYIDWRSIIISVKSQLYEGMSTQDIQLKLIEECNNRQTWYHSLVAGKLYCAYISKKIYPDKVPTVYELHKKLQGLGLMTTLDYSQEEYNEIESYIDHSKNFQLSYMQVYQLVNKYGLTDRVTKIKHETPQFIFMRMSMALSEDEDNRLERVKKFYTYLSDFKINAPTPNYINLGTKHNGYISCCLYTVNDNVESLAVGDHIAYTMTYMSAGIGGYLNTRSVNDKVKNGSISHMGKLPYYKAVAAAVSANTQSGRGGSCTQHFSCYDPEALDIIYLQNPRTPTFKQIRDIHFSMQFNTFFIERVYNNENIFTFNCKTAPDLHNALFTGDRARFKAIYNEYENNKDFKKVYVSAREIALAALKQCNEVATLYLINLDEVNTHTPYREPIYQSNLCQEITQPTKGYDNILDLYSSEEHERGEISLCALGGIVPSFITSDEEYEDVAYYTLLMIDKCIHKNSYVFKHLEFTAKARMNAGVGMIGLAYDLAKHNLKFSSKEGLERIHFLAERHMYFLIKASIKLGKEKGNARFMHKTKWPDGWTPMDTYNRNVDSIQSFTNKYDWNKLKQELINNKGMRNSSLVAYMPTESSSKVTGMPNGIYPIRDIYMKKTDSTLAIDSIARESNVLADNYELAWDISAEDLLKAYSVIQKFADQSISADFYSDRTINKELRASKLLDEFYCMYKYGIKTRYYTNSKTTSGIKLQTVEDRGCSSGVCTL